VQLPRADTTPYDLDQAGAAPTRPAASAGPAAEPVVGKASAAGWRHWLMMLITFGQERIAALGLTLGLGLAVAMLALYSFAVLADEVMEEETLRVDNAVLATLRLAQSPFLDDAAWFVSALGAEILAVLLVGLVGVLGWKRRWGAAVSLLVTVGGAQLLNNVLKDWFHRTRPAPVDALIPAQAFSFPSGHAMVAAAFYLFVGYLAWRLLAGRARIICVALLVLVAFLIGLSRLYLGVHYLTDVIAGYVAGIAWTQAVVIGGQLLARRGRRPAMLPPEHPSEDAAPPPLRGDLRVPADALRQERG
jgi:undecaprenyl-diphosphatase